MTFKDKSGQTIDDPEDDLLSLAAQGKFSPSTGVVDKPALPTQSEVLKSITSETPTPTTCTCQTSVADNNIHDLKKISETINSTASSAAGPTASAAPAVPSTPTTSQIWASDPWISKYETAPKVQNMIRIARRTSHASSRRLCYKYVKQDLLGSGMIGSYPPGRFAKKAVGDLEAQGMVNLLDYPQYKSVIGQDPSKVPKGAVIVYSTGEKSEAGHIEIKTGDGGRLEYISDYHSSLNIQQSIKGQYKERIGKPYQIIGVMVLPEGKL
jgi:hypothetical protein